MFKLLVTLSLLCSGQLVLAQVMSPEKSKCYSAEQLAVKQRGWHADFQRFLRDFDQVSDQDKFQIMGIALEAIATSMNQFIQSTTIKQPNVNRTRDAVHLLDNYKNNRLTRSSGIPSLKLTLIDLDADFQKMLEQADSVYPACDFTGLKSQRKAELELPETSA